MFVLRYLGGECCNAIAGLGDLGNELIDRDADNFSIASNDDGKPLAPVTLDDIEERLIESALGEQMHRDAGSERKFVVHTVRLNSPTIFSKSFFATTVSVFASP